MKKDKPTYPRQTYLSAVIKASSAKGNAMNTLLYCCMMSDFEKPRVAVTKDAICDTINAGRRAIAEALSFLREEGTLRPIKGMYGGKHVAVTYELVICTGKTPAEQNHVTPEDEREARYRSLARKFGAIKALDMMND